MGVYGGFESGISYSDRSRMIVPSNAEQVQYTANSALRILSCVGARRIKVPIKTAGNR